MGPFAVGDLAGLDIGYAIRQRRYVEKPHVTYSRVGDRVVELGRLGQKTGKGWYRYEAGDRTQDQIRSIDELVTQYRSEIGMKARTITDEEIVQRCVYALVNEGARILEEGHCAARERYRRRLSDRLWFSGGKRWPDVLWPDGRVENCGRLNGRVLRRTITQIRSSGSRRSCCRKQQRPVSGRVRLWPSSQMSLKKLFDLSGKTALITGGSRGLGLQIAEALGEMGARLVLSARKPDELQAASAKPQSARRRRTCCRRRLVQSGRHRAARCRRPRAPRRNRHPRQQCRRDLGRTCRGSSARRVGQSDEPQCARNFFIDAGGRARVDDSPATGSHHQCGFDRGTCRVTHRGR